jgi:hypothetical protein
MGTEIHPGISDNGPREMRKCRFSSLTALSQVRLHHGCTYAANLRHAVWDARTW